MDIFKYLGVKEDYNILTKDFYFYGNKVAILKTGEIIPDVHSKLKNNMDSLSELLKLPVKLVDQPYSHFTPDGVFSEELNPNFIICDRNNQIIYSEHIIEKVNTPTSVIMNTNGSLKVERVRSLYLKWTFRNRQTFYRLLSNDKFNTVYPNGYPFDITKTNIHLRYSTV